MNIGLYFGSFNPVHIGHLIIASHVANNSDLNQVWLVVSPHNPLKHSNSLLNEYHRLHLIQSSLEGEKNLKVSNIEFNLPKPSYTIDTLAYLKEKYPAYEFSIIIGSDGFQNLDNWKNAEVIIANYPIIIYKRPGFDINTDLGAKIQIMKAPLLEISATYIRELIQRGKSIKHLVPSSVEEEISTYGFFKKIQKK